MVVIIKDKWCQMKCCKSCKNEINKNEEYMSVKYHGEKRYILCLKCFNIQNPQAAEVIELIESVEMPTLEACETQHQYQQWFEGLGEEQKSNITLIALLWYYVISTDEKNCKTCHSYPENCLGVNIKKGDKVIISGGCCKLWRRKCQQEETQKVAQSGTH